MNGILVDIIGRRMTGWVAPDTVSNVASLVNADIIDVHLARENHVLKVLLLEGSYSKRY
jgi:hypothetical protein